MLGEYVGETHPFLYPELNFDRSELSFNLSKVATVSRVSKFRPFSSIGIMTKKGSQFAF